MSFRVNVHSVYCPVGRMSGRANIYRASVRGLLPGRATVFWVSVHQPTVSCGCFLKEVFLGLV